MIGWLSGTIRQRKEDRVLIDTGGVGYEVHVAKTSSMGNAGDLIEIYIHTHVREDAITLFGFSSIVDRELFQQLIGVSGVGAKMAMNILSALNASQIVQAILSKDNVRLQQIHGVGKRLAQRLVIELSDRLKDFSLPGGAEKSPPFTSLPSSSEDVISALINLGYKRPQAEQALDGIDLSKSSSFDRILRESLKQLAK